MTGTNALVAFIREHADELAEAHTRPGDFRCPHCGRWGHGRRDTDERCPAMRDRDAVLTLVTGYKEAEKQYRQAYRSGLASIAPAQIKLEEAEARLCAYAVARWQDDMTPEQREAWTGDQA